MAWMIAWFRLSSPRMASRIAKSLSVIRTDTLFVRRSPSFGFLPRVSGATISLGVFDMINPLILALLLGSGCAPMPEKPEPHSIAFICSFNGFRVLEGWITVSEARAEIAEDINLDQYWLDCDSPSLDGLKCRTASQ